MSQKTAKKQPGVTNISLTVPKAKVAETYQAVLKDAAKNVSIKGFRKGKAPIAQVEKSLDKAKLYQQVLETLLPELISEEIKKKGLKPIANPKLKPVSMKENQDWNFIVEVIEFPDFKLGDYKKHVKGALQATKIWVPGDDKSKPTTENRQPKTDKSLSDKRLKKVFDALLDNVSVPVAATLVSEDVNRTLTRLLDQTQKLGVTIDQYLASLGKTSQQLRDEYAKTAEENLKLEFILQKIADEINPTVTDQEVDDLTKTIPTQSASKRTYIKAIIRKRKTIDYLLKLA